MRWLVPQPPKALSTVLVLPSKMPPAARSLRTIVPLSVERRFFCSMDPQVVIWFFNSKISFNANGMPWNGPILPVVAKALSAACAARNASSA